MLFNLVTMIRVVVVGARRRRQGLGAFVARFFSEVGAEVCGVVGTSQKSAEEAAAALLSNFGLQTRAYGDLAEALTAERPDAVAICSPYELHREHLAITANAGCHCLCEKPLWWEANVDERAARTTEIAAEFERRKLNLTLLSQWPYTLPGFYSLYPDLEGRTVESFRMELGPVSHGATMILDAAPHALSMLQHILGSGVIVDYTPRYLNRDRTDVELHFGYQHTSGTAEVICNFKTTPEAPRPAAYALNGHGVERQIHMSNYELFLEAIHGQTKGTKIKISDPLGLIVEDFARKVTRQELGQPQALTEGVALLEVLYEGAR
ncbi:MAG: Gfo/Idh/MocA family oxidoreductase [Planctomycetes bacterium]|nr:Gfo/Idh/MocA family oxidoreductase [Planctomycetota bacterium]